MALDHLRLGEFFVEEIGAETVAGALQLRDHVADLLDSVDLLVQVVGLQEVAEMRIAVVSSSNVQLQKTFVHSLLQLECALESVQRAAPLHCCWFRDVLEDDFAATTCLVLHQHRAVAPLLLGGFAEVLGEARKSLIISAEPGAHGQIDIARIELHVDLLVDQSLGLFVKVLPDLRRHLDSESFFFLQ